jgi:hypothetical protein
MARILILLGCERRTARVRRIDMRIPSSNSGGNDNGPLVNYPPIEPGQPGQDGDPPIGDRPYPGDGGLWPPFEPPSNPKPLPPGQIGEGGSNYRPGITLPWMMPGLGNGFY